MMANLKILPPYAASKGMNYITPEDISAALEAGCDETELRMEVLAIIGKQTPYALEDGGLCAFIAWRGRETPGTQ